tara:strand:- start:33 stop:179 length:147 start_codon:yes stop_codon:yes gene_type:complete
MIIFDPANWILDLLLFSVSMLIITISIFIITLLISVLINWFEKKLGER